MKWILIAYGITFGIPITAAILSISRGDVDGLRWDCRHVYGGLVTY